MRFRSFLFMICYLATTFPIIVAGSLVGIFIPYKARFFVPIAIFHGTNFWLRVTCGITYRIEGLENLPKGKTLIVVSNHQSTWETYALQTFIVPICTILKRELLFIPFFGWSLAYLRPIAINRANAVAASKKVLKTGAARLKSGISVLIFPEGTRVKVGEKREFKKSAAVLARQTGVDILPVAHNAGARWAAREFVKKSGTIVMRIGKPIETRGKSAEAIREEYTAWIEKTASEL